MQDDAVKWSSAAKKRIFPSWLGPKDKRPKTASVDVAAGFKALGVRFRLHQSAWMAGIGKAAPGIADHLRAAEEWLLAGNAPPQNTDPNTLAVVLSMHRQNLEGGAPALDTFVEAIAAQCGPATAMEAWLRAHAWWFTFDTPYFMNATKEVWLREYAWPVQLIEKGYELSTWAMLRRMLAVASPEEQARAIAAAERMFVDLPATPENVDIRTSWEVALCFAIPARPDFARALVPRVLAAWNVKRASSFLSALEVTGQGLLASLDDHDLARDIVVTGLSILSTAPRFMQVYVETIADRFGRDAWDLLTPIVKKIGWEKSRIDDFDVALKRVVEALLMIERREVVDFLLEDLSLAMASKAGKLVRTYFARTGPMTLEAAQARPRDPSIDALLLSLGGGAVSAPPARAPAPLPKRALPEAMSEEMKKLIARVPPPAHYIAPPPPPKTRREMPADYLAILDVYGLGAFIDFARIHPEAWIEDQGMSILEGERKSQAMFPKESPLPFWPEPNGLLIFGRTDNGDRLYFQTRGKPDEWPIVVWESRGPRHQIVRGGLAEFLHAWLSWKLEIEMFPEQNFPWEDDDMDRDPAPWFQPALRFKETKRVLSAPEKKQKWDRRVADLSAAWGGARAIARRSREEKRADHMITDRDWIVTLEETDDGPTTLAVRHPEEEQELALSEIARVTAVVNVRVIA